MAAAYLFAGWGYTVTDTKVGKFEPKSSIYQNFIFQISKVLLHLFVVRDQSCLKTVHLWFKGENNFILVTGGCFLHFNLFLSNFIIRATLNLTRYNFGGMIITLREC